MSFIQSVLISLQRTPVEGLYFLSVNGEILAVNNDSLFWNICDMLKPQMSLNLKYSVYVTCEG
jgi:hypothetical protein